MVLVKETCHDTDRDRNQEIPLFDTVYLATQRINQYAREDTISVYVLKDAKADINKILKDNVNRSKHKK
jgi:hypothetical protein